MHRFLLLTLNSASGGFASACCVLTHKQSIYWQQSGEIFTPQKSSHTLRPSEKKCCILYLKIAFTDQFSKENRKVCPIDQKH